MLLDILDSALKKSIVRQLYFEGSLSCADLSLALNKSVPVITRGVVDLVDAGWVEEAGFAASRGGRRPMMYRLKEKDYYIVSVAMNRLGAKLGILNLLNEPACKSHYFELHLKDNPDAARELVALIQSFTAKAKIPHDRILGVGIAMPGFININRGINYSYMSTPGDGSLRDFLSTQLSLPVFLDNDSSIIALAELRFGEARGYKEAMVINIGWGIGLGMIINGELFRGHAGFAGELSHIPISDSGKLCYCGKRGCLETEATLLVVTEKARKEIAEGKITSIAADKDAYNMSELLMQAANEGNQEAIGLFSDMGYKIGKALAILIHIVNPELIVLSGRGALVGRILMAPIQQSLNEYCIPRLYENTELTVSKLGKDVELIGAAALVMEGFGQE